MRRSKDQFVQDSSRSPLVPIFTDRKKKKKKERKKKTNLSPILPTETSLLVCLRDRFCFPPLLFESEASAFLAKFLLLYANYSAL